MLKISHAEYEKHVLTLKLKPLFTFTGFASTGIQKLQCLVCKKVFSTRAAGLLYKRNRLGCPYCYNTTQRMYNRKRTPEEYKQLMKEHLPKILPLEDYVHADYPILHRCLVCKFEKRVRPNTYIRYHGSGSPCRQCATQDVSTWFKRKPHKFGSKRTESVQGSESKVLSELKARGIRSQHIAVTPAQGKPVIPMYRGERKSFYLPDFFIKNKNEVVEVKSTYTLGLHKNAPAQSWFDSTVSKALATKAAGYKFSLWLVSGEDCIKLHPGWSNLSRTELGDIIFSELKCKS